MTSYRRGVPTGERIRYLNAICGTVCSDFGAALAERTGQEDHLHPLAGHPPKVPMATLVNSLNGVPARMLRQRYRIRIHREHLWSRFHFAASCGGAPLSIIRQYVAQQRTPGG